MKSITDHREAIILGVRISGSPRSKLLSKISQQLDTKHKSATIYTPNPEIVLLASSDAKLRDILNSADFSVADGVGLKLALVLTKQGSQPLSIYPGRLLMEDLLSIAAQRQLKVFFLGTTSGRVIHKALQRIKLEYPTIDAQGNTGPIFDVNAIPKTSSDKKLENKVISEINSFNPDILFVAFGAPKQEKWIYSHKDNLKANIIMAVGGSLDYFAAVKPLPPKWLASIGMEWLWRGIKEKGHYKRLWRAVIIFPLTVLLSKWRD